MSVDPKPLYMNKTLLISVLGIFCAALSPAQTPSPVAAQRALLDQYCVGCHSQKLKTGGFILEKVDPALAGQQPEMWEKVIRKVRAGLMPPARLPRPTTEVMNSFASGLETTIDKASSLKPNPGSPALHRVNRAEYANSIKSLVGLDIDPSRFLPTDDMSHGFDNMAEVLNISSTLMEGYVRAAGKISRLAVGDPGATPLVETYQIRTEHTQTRHVEGTPLGTRGGTAFTHIFPADGEYIFRMTFFYNNTGTLFGSVQKAEQLEVSINGERAALLEVSPRLPVTGDVRTAKIKVKAGPQKIAVAFLNKFDGPVDDAVMPFERSLADLSIGSVPGLTGLVHLRDVGINGPYNVTGVSDTPSRAKIFICRPASGADEVPCAKKIISALSRQAFRRPVTESDVENFLTYFQQGRTNADFDSGIQRVIQVIAADPEFVFRFERVPANIKAGETFRVSDLELASRISFFLWSAPPDDQLITLASQNKLHEPKVLDAQVLRMLADPKANAMATNFAGQWLYLRNLQDTNADNYLYPDYDENLKDSMRKETEMFFDSFLRDDRSVIDMLTANYTYIDERLARHYGIPNVMGTNFRKVQLTDPNRYGLLGQGSFLAATSLANRTSPVNRGKWVLEQILGVKAPTPPPNVPPLKDKGEGAKVQSVREKMEEHRANEPCKSCHQIMDPIGFSLENFDAVGMWRTRDVFGVDKEEAMFFPIDPSGTLYDGTKVNGVADLRSFLVRHSNEFMRTFTEKMLTYALGRGTEYYDMPVVRAINRDAAAKNNRFSAVVLGVVKSAPFQMRQATATPATGGAAAH